MKINDFSYSEKEKSLYIELLRHFSPDRIAEFGAGKTTSVLAQQTSANIVSWDNTEKWLNLVRESYQGTDWYQRVEFQTYEVTPKGGRDLEKDPIVWRGPLFDFILIDGPRSAHPTSYGRSGSFKFAALHTREGGCIVWHDNDRLHENVMAFKYLGHCLIHNEGRIGWCVWQHPQNWLSWTFWNNLSFRWRKRKLLA